MNSVVTLLTDYGNGSIYGAMVEGAVHKVLGSIKFTVLSHEIEAFDVNQAAFFLNLVYPSYPEGTWHIIGVDSSIHLHQQFLVVQYQNQFFIGADNGVFSLLFQDKQVNVYRVLNEKFSIHERFAEKNVFPEVIASYLRKGSLQGIAEPGEIKNHKTSLHPTMVENNLHGTVMMIDGFGNAITNITREVFEKARNGRYFKVYYWRKHFIEKISNHYHDGAEGEDLLLFNEGNYLEIGIYKGRGAQLLGLRKGSNIVVEFGN